MLITENFLLQSDQAVALYHDYARDLPVFDYHCHLPPQQIADDHRFANLAEIWLHGDHYKWRAMRSAGVPEKYCTGDASDWEKFSKWAEAVPQTLRNPLYHWTHLELNRPFGIKDLLLSPATAKLIWDRCNSLLATDDFTCRGIMQQMGVVLVCTTDDPADTLEHHAAIRSDPSFKTHVLPTFRPDRAWALDNPATFNAWVDRLSEVSGVDIGDCCEKLLAALHQRHDVFHSMGCRLSDHGLETVDPVGCSSSERAGIFARARRGDVPTPDEVARFRMSMLHEMALWDHARGWTQQFHIGPIRNNNSRLFRQIGPDAGFDSIGDACYAKPLAAFLDRLDGTGQLARTILYNINPSHNEMLATMIGNFQDGSIAGKMQFGSGWWFLDQKDGMERQINDLSNMGLLSKFVGMVTDSRSFLSYTRHEYFRRILCNLLGSDMALGLLPNDMSMIGELVRDVCYRNAVRYFDFGLELPFIPS